MIELQEITKRYEEHTAVDHLSLEIKKGEIFGLLGPNGAGKSTTILMMLGLTEPTSGRAAVCELDPTKEPIAVKRKVGYLPDDLGFYEDRTGKENLVYTAMLNGMSKEKADQQADHLLERVGLRDAADKKTGKYSRGMRQRLGLADVLIKQPELIILDEPTLGIDPEGVKELLELIYQLSREDGMTVLLSSHHLHQVQQICDRVGLFVKGKLLAVGDVHSLAAQLFADEPVTTTLRAEPLSDDLINKLKALPQVIGVERKENMLEVCSESDVTAACSKIVIENGASLHYVSMREYGLDEIYHRYFEGGDVRVPQIES